MTTLKEEREVGPGCVDIIPRKRVTPQVRTWLYSEHTDRRRKMAGIKKVKTKKKNDFTSLALSLTSQHDVTQNNFVF